MNWLEFWSSIVGSLAWPVSAGMIALIFRGQIKLLFSRLEELGFGDWKLRLNKDLEEAEQVASELPAPPHPEAGMIFHDAGRRFDELLLISPNAAILDRWLAIEDRLEKIATRLNFPVEQRRNTIRVIESLRTNPILPPTVISLLQELRQIRNIAVHNSKVDQSDAIRFKKLAEQVTPFLLPSLFGND